MFTTHFMVSACILILSAFVIYLLSLKVQYTVLLIISDIFVEYYTTSQLIKAGKTSQENRVSLCDKYSPNQCKDNSLVAVFFLSMTL